MTVTLNHIGTPVVSIRPYATGIVPRVGGGWNWIRQLYNDPNHNPTEWVVMHLEDGTYHIDHDNPYVAGKKGHYCVNVPSNVVNNQLRAPDGKTYFNAVSMEWWWFDPTDEIVHDGGKVSGTTDASMYSVIFNHDGSRIYFGGIASATAPYLPSVGYIDTTTTPPTAHKIRTVGSNLHTQAAYAYYLWVIGKWLYVLVGQEVWDVVAVDLDTGAQTIIATATTKPWAFFHEVPGKGLTVQLYTNHGLTGETVDWFWVNNGARAGAYTVGVDPPFTAQDVSLYKNLVVNPPDLDETRLPSAIGWRPHGSSDPYTYNSFTLEYVAPINLESLHTLSDGRLIGNSVQYNGYYGFDPGSSTLTYYGKPAAAQQASETTFVNNGTDTYWTGYANAPLDKYDTTQPWSATNPALLGHYDNGVTQAAVKRGQALAISATYGQIYMGGLCDRSGVGAGIGDYSLSSHTFGGLNTNLEYFKNHIGLVVFDALDRIVLSGHLGADPAIPDPPPASAELVMYDHALTEIERQHPILNLQSTGKLFRTAEAHVVVGLSSDDALVYRWDVVSKTLLGTLDLSTWGTPTNISTQTADGTILTIVGTTLLRINPTTLAWTSYGAVGLTIAALAQSGSTIYAAAGPDLYQLDVTVDGGSPVIPPDDAVPGQRRTFAMHLNEVLPQLRTVRDRLLAADGTPLPSDFTFAAGDIKIVQPDGTVANTVNLPTAVTGAAAGSFDLVVDQNELQQEGRIWLQSDNPAIKFWQWVEHVAHPPATVADIIGATATNAIAAAVVSQTRLPIKHFSVGGYHLTVGDLEPPMPMRAVDGGKHVDLTGVISVSMIWVKPDGSSSTVSVVVTDAAAGTVQREWSSGDTDQQGVHSAQLVATWPESRTQTFQIVYTWEVRPPL